MEYKMGRKIRQIFRYQELRLVAVFQEVQKLSASDRLHFYCAFHFKAIILKIVHTL